MLLRFLSSPARFHAMPCAAALLLTLSCSSDDSESGGTGGSNGGSSGTAGGAATGGTAGASGGTGGASGGGGAATGGTAGASGGTGGASGGGGAATGGASGGTGGASGGTGGASGGTAQSLPFVDLFNGSALNAAYGVVHAEAATPLVVNGGALSTTVTKKTVWYQSDNDALLVYVIIPKQDFRVTSRVRARSAAVPANPIGSGYHYAGPMIRDPGSDPIGPQNFAFNAVGYQDGCSGQSANCIETKSTLSNNPTIERFVHAGSGDAQLRLCKFGAVITAYERAVSGQGNWTQRSQWNRADLAVAPALQVGLMAFSFTIAGDNLRASFDDFEIEAVASMADCTK